MGQADSTNNADNTRNQYWKITCILTQKGLLTTLIHMEDKIAMGQ